MTIHLCTSHLPAPPISQVRQRGEGKEGELHYDFIHLTGSRARITKMFAFIPVEAVEPGFDGIAIPVLELGMGEL